MGYDVLDRSRVVERRVRRYVLVDLLQLLRLLILLLLMIHGKDLK